MAHNNKLTSTSIFVSANIDCGASQGTVLGHKLFMLSLFITMVGTYVGISFENEAAIMYQTNLIYTHIVF